MQLHSCTWMIIYKKGILIIPGVYFSWRKSSKLERDLNHKVLMNVYFGLYHSLYPSKIPWTKSYTKCTLLDLGWLCFTRPDLGKLIRGKLSIFLDILRWFFRWINIAGYHVFVISKFCFVWVIWYKMQFHLTWFVYDKEWLWVSFLSKIKR